MKRREFQTIEIETKVGQRLDEMSLELNVPTGEVITRAVALLSYASKRVKEGKKLCFSDGDEIVIEVSL